MARKKKPSKRSRKFYAQQTAQSKVKAEIITKYAASRVGIMAGKGVTTVAHVDLWAGRGRYDDGAESTPLMVLRKAIADPVVRKSLVTIFNDKDHADALRAEIAKLPGIKTLTHTPDVFDMEVGDSTPDLFNNIRLVPTLAFLDPWGYKGLTRKLIGSLLKDWGCEVLFFFNFNRINRDLTNPVVTNHMEALFGRNRLASLRKTVKGFKGEARERVVMEALYEIVREADGRFIMPFRFVKAGSTRTSHYLVFASKNFLGYKIMRDVMGNAGWKQSDGVPSFEHNTQPGIFLNDGRSVKKLAKMLVNDQAGTMMTFEQVFEKHSEGKHYVEKNYRDALLDLEAKGRVAMFPPANERRPYKGRPSLRKDVRIKFPRLQSASRSTPGHLASGHPSSGANRPTA
jgi:three-Cys-motif partner protein